MVRFPGPAGAQSPRQGLDMTVRRDYIATVLTEEFRQSQDWVTVAGAVELLGISSFVVEMPVVRAILRSVNDNPTLHLISAHLGYRRMSKPIPVEPLLTEIFAKSDASDRAAAMMEYLVDVTDQPDNRSSEGARQGRSDLQNKTLTLMPNIGSRWGFWPSTLLIPGDFDITPGETSPANFNLSENLTAALRRWNDLFIEHFTVAFDPIQYGWAGSIDVPQWIEEGEVIADALEAELPDFTIHRRFRESADYPHLKGCALMQSANETNASDVLRTVEIARRHVDPQASPISSQWIESLHSELTQLQEAGRPFTVENLTVSLINMLIRTETEWTGSPGSPGSPGSEANHPDAING